VRVRRTAHKKGQWCTGRCNGGRGGATWNGGHEKEQEWGLQKKEVLKGMRDACLETELQERPRRYYINDVRLRSCEIIKQKQRIC